MKELLAKLRKPVEIPVEGRASPSEAISEFQESDFIAAVERAKRYIFDGDIMQVVLSQRISMPYGASPLALYRALRSAQSFAVYVLLPFWRFPRRGRIAGDSGAAGRRTVTVRPIAGTRPRGKTREMQRSRLTCWPIRRNAPNT